jgi:hypothetical protein
MSSIEERRLARRLPFWRTVAGTYEVLFAHFGAFLARAWMWMVIAYVLRVLLGLAPVSIPTFLKPYSFVSMLCSVPVLVHWHRRILLQETGGRIFRFGAIEAHFLIFALLLAVMNGAPSWIMGLYAWQLSLSASLYVLILAPIAATIALVLITARLSVMFPAIAVGAPRFKVRHAWAITRGSTLRLFFGLIAITIPVIPVGWVLVWTKFLILAFGGYAVLLLAVIDIACAFVYLGLCATFLSLAFRWFVQAERGPA